MAIGRDDRWVADAQGRALAGALVYWLNQPADTTVTPPVPLATIYTDISGTTQKDNPQVSDGFGHAFAYMDDSVLYTLYISHPLFGPSPIVLPDQRIGGGGGGGSVTPFAGVPDGVIDGVNTVFTLTNNGIPLTATPIQADVWLNFPLIPSLGYTISGVTVTYAVAPQPASGGVAADAIYAQGLLPS